MKTRVAPSMTLSPVVSAIVVSLTFVSFAPAARAQGSTPSYKVEVVASRVWSNDDMDQLRARGLISTFEPTARASSNAPLAPTPARLESASAPPLVRERDPEWYAHEAARLQRELDDQKAILQYHVQTLEDVRNREHMAAGVTLDRGNIGVTPEAGIDVLEARVADISRQLDDLADMARVNGIAPGVLRG